MTLWGNIITFLFCESTKPLEMKLWWKCCLGSPQQYECMCVVREF